MRWIFIVMMLVGLIAACGGEEEGAETPEVTAITEVTEETRQEAPTGEAPDVNATVAAAVQATLEAQPEATNTPEATATNTTVSATATSRATVAPRPTKFPAHISVTPQPQLTATPRSEFTIGPGGGPEYTDGHYVTIHSIEDPVISSNQFLQPDPGNRFLSLDTEICAGTKESSANPYNFEFQMPDNTRRDPGIGVREPSLNGTQLAPGDCVRGWTTFQITDGETPAFIIYEGPGYKPAKFVWPE